MSAVTITPDVLLALAMSDRTDAMTRLVLLSAERANRRGFAKFDRGELLDLLNEGRVQPLDTYKLRGLMRRAMDQGLLAEGSRTSRPRLPEGIVVRSGGLRALTTLENGRALAECADCEHRAIYAETWLTSEAAACPRCRTREQSRTAA